VRTAILLAALASSLWGQPLRPTPDAPPVTGVTLENAVYNPANHTLDYDLVNQTQKYVSAWALVQYFKNERGDESVGGWALSEMAGSAVPKTPQVIAAGTPAFGMLAPAERRHAQSVARAGTGTADVTSMRVNLAAVIYDDASAEGDDAFLNHLFASRKARSDELQRWVPQISALKTSANPAADAQQLYQDMVEASYQEDKSNVGDVTTEQRAGRQERQRLLESIRNLVKSAEAKRPLDSQVNRLETEADSLLAGAVRRN